MTKADFEAQLSSILKLIRVEVDYTQDKMADCLGISKKTLVQIEKGRSLLGWTSAVAVATLFRGSRVLQSTIGGDPLELVEALAFTEGDRPQEKTLGGKVWWTNIKELGGFRLQQNLISRHYRILDDQDRRWCSSFDLDQMVKRLEELAQKNFY